MLAALLMRMHVREGANLFFLYLLRSAALLQAEPANFMRPFSRGAHSAAAVQPKPPGSASVGSLHLSPNVQIRTARREDIPAIECCNLKSLPENYPSSFYHNHLMQWPYLALVAEKTPKAPEDVSRQKRIVGYVLGRVEHGISPYDGSIAERRTGHVSSLAVSDEFRRHGIGKELMEILHLQMKFRYGVDASTLHVRCTNRAAQKLYVDKLGYSIIETVPKYYQDGADAYYMKLDFNQVPEEEEEEELEMATAAGGASPAAAGRGRQRLSPVIALKERGLAALSQDSQGYFQLYRSSPPGRPSA